VSGKGKDDEQHAESDERGRARDGERHAAIVASNPLQVVHGFVNDA
jgi:hypothetical protein